MTTLTPLIKYPLIEICGPPNCGKQYMARLLARKLPGSVYYSFPNLNPVSATGAPLLTLLANSPQDLERYPEWWAHIYAANLFEFRDQIKTSLKYGPVIVTNYTEAFKLWNSVLTTNTIQVYLKNLPYPNITCSVYGDELIVPHSMQVPFSPTFLARLRMLFAKSAKTMKLRVDYGEAKYPHLVLNKCTGLITDLVAKRYPHVTINPLAVYTSTDFSFKVKK